MASIHAHGSGFRVHDARIEPTGKSPTLPSREAAEAWIRDRLPAAIDGSMFNLVDLWRGEEPSPHREDAADRLSIFQTDPLPVSESQQRRRRRARRESGTPKLAAELADFT